MDFATANLIIAVLGVLGAWNALIERRMHTMYKQLVEKMEDKQEINKAVQEELKNQIARLEAKIDMLLHLNMRSPTDK